MCDAHRMTLFLDAGALLALERDDAKMWRRMKSAAAAGVSVVTHGGVVAQVWRGGHGRQALLARALNGVEVVALDDRLGRAAGLLIGKARSTDAIDAAVVALTTDGDRIVTSDPIDIAVLVEASGRHVDIIPV
ncbi:MAG: hypothetical protein NVS3B12_23680 [Acidimicrobiales bacterium]